MLNTIEKRFESLDVMDQTKMLRLTLDENRLDRFINLFDQKNFELKRRLGGIRDKAQPSLLSKSVVLERG